MWGFIFKKTIKPKTVVELSNEKVRVLYSNQEIKEFREGDNDITDMALHLRQEQLGWRVKSKKTKRKMGVYLSRTLKPDPNKVIGFKDTIRKYETYEKELIKKIENIKEEICKTL